MGLAQEDSARGIGDNRAPFVELLNQLNADIPDYLTAEREHLVSSAEALIMQFDNCAPATVEDDETEKLATDMGGQLQKIVKLLDAQRVIDKAPTLQAGRIVDNFYNVLTTKLSPRLEALRRRVNAYKDQKAAKARREAAEQERIAREARAEAERLSRVAQDAANAESRKKAEAIAKSAEKEARAAEKAIPTISEATKATGSAGTQSVQKTAWVGEVTNYDELDLNALRPYISRSELDKAVQRYAVQFKDTKPLDGAKISEKSNTAFKG